MNRRNRDIDARLWLKLHKNQGSGCWEWTGCITSAGYAKMKVGPGLVREVHRYVYELVNGPIPDGLFVLHHCDNRLCCNPVHLFLGTPSDNMRDMLIKGRAAKNHQGRKGKLKSEQVIGIRRRYRAGGVTYKQLAREYGVVVETIGAIVNGRTWQRLKQIKEIAGVVP